MTVDSKLDAVRRRVSPGDRDARDATGLLLGRLTALPALVFLPFLLVGFPFLLVGYFKPIPVIVLWLALTAAVVPYVWRRIPSVTGAAGWGTAGAGQAKPTPRWTLWSLVAISVAFGAFQAVYHSQFIIVEYDAASYMQFANWISGHGTTIIPQDAAAFGGHPASITFASAAFYQVGNHIVPQFMAGMPMVLSLGFWAGGMRLALFWGPVLGALAVFTFGGLVARLVGPRWAPFAALAIGVTVPMQYVSRSTWSEPLALILLVGGLSLWIDAQRTDRGQEDAASWRTDWRHHARSASHVLAAVAGLLLGLVFLVRLDGPSDILFVIPYCGLLLLRRQRQAVPFIAGLIVGTAYGAADGAFLTRPYLIPGNTSSVKGLAALIVAMLIGNDRGGVVAAAARLRAAQPAEAVAGQGGDNPPVRRDRRLHHPALRGAELALRHLPRLRPAQPALDLLVHRCYDHRVRGCRLRDARQAVHQGRGAGLGASPPGVRLGDPDLPAPAGDHPAPAVRQPSAGSRGAARPDPARGVAGRLAHSEVAGSPPGGCARLPEAHAPGGRDRHLRGRHHPAADDRELRRARI